jgi:hypothetical protein
MNINDLTRHLEAEELFRQILELCPEDRFSIRSAPNELIAISFVNGSHIIIRLYVNDNGTYHVAHSATISTISSLGDLEAYSRALTLIKTYNLRPAI